MKTKALIKNVMNLAVFASLAASSQPSLAQSVEETKLNNYLQTISSSGAMKTDELTILMDNQKSLEEKVRTIKAAQHGDKLFLKYYIYADDETTSVLSREIIEAARRGAEVHILVDYLTNYKRIDMFNMMVSESRGNLKVSFFNPPTAAIHRDVLYMTTNCIGASTAQCKEQKERTVEEIVSKNSSQHIGEGHVFSKLFLAGLSGKSPDALKTAVTSGGTLPDLKSSDEKEMTEDQKKQLMELAKIMFGAKVLGQTSDKIKLVLAMIFHGDDVMPIYNAVENALPLNTKKSQNAGKDWEEITQFTHHKLLALVKKGSRHARVLLGGRNLENSYHINEEQRKLTPKYLFADTDSVFSVSNSDRVKQLETSIAEMIGYKKMIASIEEVNRLLPSDYLYEGNLLKKIITEKSKKIKNFDRLAMEVELEFDRQRQGLAEKRQALAKQKLDFGVKKYFETKKATADAVAEQRLMPDFTLQLDEKDKRTAKAYYLENLTSSDPGKLDQLKSYLFGQHDADRVYNPDPNALEKNNKNIHAAWIEWIKSEASLAQRTQQVRTIYINQGYVFLPSVLVDLFAQMMDGRIPSDYVQIKILTNSIQTTDLSPINVLARHQFKALYDFYEQNKGRSGVLKNLEIFEYNVLENGNKTSNHSKQIVSPSGFYIGSANGEVRSYETDTNNGVLVTEAPRTASALSEHLERITQNTKTMTNTTSLYKRAHSRFLNEDGLIVQEIASKYKKLAERMGPLMPEISSYLVESMTDVYLMTALIADPHGARDWAGRSSTVMNPEIYSQKNATGSAALTCSKVFTSKAKHLNTKNDIQERLRKIKSEHGEKLKANFDRLFQLI